MVKARWSFSTNIFMIQCVQHIMVQVRAIRNVTFEWVAGHSGDRWDDAADDVATLGQHLLTRTRWGCRTGRLDLETPRTILALDPREDPRISRELAAARALVPPLH